MTRSLQITLHRAEGPIEDCREPVVVTSYAEADAQLHAWATTAPKEGGGYDKVDFTVTVDHFGDPHEYKGRFDLQREHGEKVKLLQHQMLDFFKWSYGIS